MCGWLFLQVFRGETSVFSDPRQHFGAYLVTVAKRENIIGPTGAGENTMRGAALPFDCPTDTKQGGEYFWGSG